MTEEEDKRPQAFAITESLRQAAKGLVSEYAKYMAAVEKNTQIYQQWFKPNTPQEIVQETIGLASEKAFKQYHKAWDYLMDWVRTHPTYQYTETKDFTPNHPIRKALQSLVDEEIATWNRGHDTTLPPCSLFPDNSPRQGR